MDQRSWIVNQLLTKTSGKKSCWSWLARTGCLFQQHITVSGLPPFHHWLCCCDYVCYSMRYLEEEGQLNWGQLGPPSFVCVCVLLAFACEKTQLTSGFYVPLFFLFYLLCIWVMRQTELCRESPVELHWPTPTALNRKC